MPRCSLRFGPARRQRRPLLALLVIGLLLAAGCGSVTGQPEEPDLWSPFRSQSNWIVNDGTMRLELSGFERGHEPGQEAEFQLTVENRLGEPVETEVCAMLIDEVSIVQQLERLDVDLEPGQATIQLIVAEFEEELEPKPYGLAILLEEWGAIVHTIRLGVPDEEAGTWLDASALSCDS